jgi:hypothetical protein
MRRATDTIKTTYKLHRPGPAIQTKPSELKNVEKEKMAELFRINDRVILSIQNKYKPTKMNPVVGTDYFCEGDVIWCNGEDVEIAWDNGHTNTYKRTDLSFAKAQFRIATAEDLEEGMEIRLRRFRDDPDHWDEDGTMREYSGRYVIISTVNRTADDEFPVQILIENDDRRFMWIPEDFMVRDDSSSLNPNILFRIKKGRRNGQKSSSNIR